MRGDGVVGSPDMGDPSDPSRRTRPIVTLIAAALIAAAILGAGWMISHPDEASRCAISGGSWQATTERCWYPQTSQPLVNPVEGDPEPSLPPAPGPSPAGSPKD